MKSLVVFLLLLAAYPLAGQVAEATVCDILANPKSFDGKILRVKGEVSADFDEFVLKDLGCDQPVNAIWIAYPAGTKGRAGAVASVRLQLARNNSSAVNEISRSAVKLDMNKDFKQFDTALSIPYKAHGMCLGCVRYTVKATLVGRLDGVNEAGVVRDKLGKVVAVNGFGNLNLYKARLVLQSVSDIVPQEVDFSRVTSATKDDSQKDAAGGDPVAMAHQSAKAFGLDSAPGKQIERAAAAFGKEGESNGVEVGFGPSNELPKDDLSKGSKDSPDGLLLNCAFDADRLKGDALARAIAHVGEHIADIRDIEAAASPANLYDLESRAWQTTVLSAVASQQKTLTLPGGYLVWSSAWAPSDRGRLVDTGIAEFLTKWALLKQ